MKFTQTKKPQHGKIAKQAAGLQGYDKQLEGEQSYWQDVKNRSMASNATLQARHAGEFLHHLGDLITIHNKAGSRELELLSALGSLPPTAAEDYKRGTFGMLALSKLTKYVFFSGLGKLPSTEVAADGRGVMIEYPVETGRGLSDTRLHMPGEWMDIILDDTATKPSTWYKSEDNSLYLRRTLEATPETAFMEAIMEQKGAQERVNFDGMQTLFPYLPSK